MESSLSPEECRRIAEELDRCCQSKSLSLRLVTEAFADVPREAVRRSDFLNIACANEYVGPDVVRFLAERYPDEVDGRGHHLLRTAMENWHMSDRVKLEIVRVLVEACPGSVRRRTCGVVGDVGSLPIQVASAIGTLGMVEFLFSLYPEGLRLPDEQGRYPIHLAASRRDGGKVAVIEFILRHDREGASRVASGRLPLQMACGPGCPEFGGAVLALSDAYPEAIFPTVHGEDLQSTVSGRWGYYSWCAGLLRTLAAYAHLSQDREVLTRKDSDGLLPLHHALNANAPLGAIKLLVRAYPGALRAADARGNYPLHLACSEGRPGVVSYLLEEDAAPASERNVGGELPVQLLCASAREDEGGTGRVEVIWRLLLACPDVFRPSVGRKGYME